MSTLYCCLRTLYLYNLQMLFCVLYIWFIISSIVIVLRSSLSRALYIYVMVIMFISYIKTACIRYDFVPHRTVNKHTIQYNTIICTQSTSQSTRNTNRSYVSLVVYVQWSNMLKPSTGSLLIWDKKKNISQFLHNLSNRRKNLSPPKNVY